jgi:uncharacterized membrane protein SpoIIM required for sporulation
LRLAFFLFWGTFLAAMLYAASSPRFAEEILGKGQMQKLEAMYSTERGGDVNEASEMFGFYVFNNPSVGLLCFASGLFFGVGDCS